MSDLSSTIFFKIISVLLIVVVGFLAGRLKKVDRDGIASLIFYFVSPILFFSVPLNIQVTFSNISISILTFCIGSILCFSSYYFYKFYFPDRSKNIIAMSSGTGNMGYFIIPIATAILDEYQLNIYMMAIMGTILYETSIGFFVCMKSDKTTLESIKRVIKLPTLNAFILGCLFSYSGLQLPVFLDDFINSMRASYSILGMVMIGLGISTVSTFKIDMKFTGSIFLNKFFIYPLFINILILIDIFILHFYNINYYKVLLLLSCAPVSGNTIIFASLVNFSPEKVATTVLLSCVFALVYIPTMIQLYFQIY